MKREGFGVSRDLPPSSTDVSAPLLLMLGRGRRPKQEKDALFFREGQWVQKKKMQDERQPFFLRLMRSSS